MRHPRHLAAGQAAPAMDGDRHAAAVAGLDVGPQLAEGLDHRTERSLTRTGIAIEPDRIQTRFHDDDGAPAWVATINRV